MYNLPLTFQCIYGHSDIGENRDLKEGSGISGGGERVKIAWPLVYR